MAQGTKELTVKSKDTFPPLETTLEQFRGGVWAPVDLTPVEKVKFIMKKDGPGNGNAQIGGNCTIIDAAGGVVAYPWKTGETDVVGTYSVEWELKYTAGGGIQSIPNEGYDQLKIESDLN